MTNFVTWYKKHIMYYDIGALIGLAFMGWFVVFAEGCLVR